jgi:Zn-dependent protease
MASEPELSAPSPARLWAEQLAIGMALLLGILIFMAIFHPKMLAVGVAVLGPDHLEAYGWASLLGVFLQVIIHEAGTLLVAWRMKIPLQFRLFCFGANATATLENQPRRVWIDAVVGFAGPLTGTLVSVLLAATYYALSYNHSADDSPSIAPYFLGMACVGYFYNLFTLIPILDLEGGWIAPAIAPQAWLFGLVATGMTLTHGFNLVLLGVFSFGLPRLILIVRARAPQLDTGCTAQQRLIVGIGYFVLVIALAWLGSATFDDLARLIPEAMGD